MQRKRNKKRNRKVPIVSQKKFVTKGKIQKLKLVKRYFLRSFIIGWRQSAFSFILLAFSHCLLAFLFVYIESLFQNRRPSQKLTANSRKPKTISSLHLHSSLPITFVRPIICCLSHIHKKVYENLWPTEHQFHERFDRLSPPLF